MRHSFKLLLAGLLFAAPLSAQTSVTFPLSPDGTFTGTALPKFRPDLDAIRALAGNDLLTMTGVPLPSGAAVEVALTRLANEAIDFGYRVDGVPAPGLADGLDLSIWKGSVVGDPSSEVLLSFSNAGTSGWVRSQGTLGHFMPQPDAAGDFANGYSILVSERQLAELGTEFQLDCGTDELLDLDLEEFDGIPTGGASGATRGTGSVSLYRCDVAVETDYQLNQVFGGSLSAETAYITTLLTAISDRYVEQHRTQLNYPYLMFYTTPADPWSTPDSGGSTSQMLSEFVNAWSGSIPTGAHLGHFISGAPLGGGIAYLSALCDVAGSFSFAVSANIDGTVPFPIVVSPNNWDFMVIAHELGHNFGSPHTHDFSPPIDTCASGGCIPNGTIMSYCHLCPGGLINITTYFHPLVVGVIAPQVESCLPLIVGLEASPPAVIAPDVPNQLTLNVTGSPTGSVDLNYRFDPLGTFTAIAMTTTGGGVYTADLPAVGCDGQPEFYFSMNDATLGPVQTATYFAEVGVTTTVLTDTFTSDLGWTAGVPGDGATTGIWVRGDPIGTAAQPSTGSDDNSCYFTGQGSPGGSLGEQDIDGGITTLVSPVIDLSAGSARISYQRWYSNSTGASPGADVFDVDVTNDGVNWVNVEQVGPTGSETSGGWFYHQFEVSDFVTPTSTVQVRFVASDLGSGSVVEAAVDEFDVFRVTCTTCQPDLGFGGPGSATLSLCGDALASGGTADLAIAGAPASEPAFVGFSTALTPTSLFGGTIVTLPLLGILSLSTDASGDASLSIGGGGGPAKFYLQGVIYDSSSGLFVITNALQADVLP
jgi:hypothetical protein